jgi:hypothetical protein
MQRPPLTLCVLAQMCCFALAHAQSPDISGTWNIEISFDEGGQHSLRFDAQADGKGTFSLMDAIAKAWRATKSSDAKWTRGGGNSLTVAGPIEFSVGNIGREPGMLMLTGKFENPDSITGGVEFSPSVGERGSKHGKFKAVRAAAGK